MRMQRDQQHSHGISYFCSYIQSGLRKRAALNVCTVTWQVDDALCYLRVGCHTSRTALHTSSAYSGSVPVKLSGLYSNAKFPSVSSASFFQKFCTVYGNLQDLFFGFFKYLFSLCHRSRIVYMYNRSSEHLSLLQKSCG